MATAEVEVPSERGEVFVKPQPWLLDGPSVTQTVPRPPHDPRRVLGAGSVNPVAKEPRLSR
jgi:hypothetical protein